MWVVLQLETSPLTTGVLKSVTVYLCPSNDHAWDKADANACPGDESNCMGDNKGKLDRQLPNSYAYNGAVFCCTAAEIRQDRPATCSW